MDTFFPVLLWGLVILAALTGWGRLPGCWSRGHNHDTADWLEAPAWGIAISSFIGSLMNLLGLASQAGVAVFILTGCTLVGFSSIVSLKKWRLDANGQRTRMEWKWLVLLALPLGALTLRFVGSVMIYTFYPYATWAAHSFFNPQDDALSYLVSPERMLQTGSLGLDPFNSRQMMSGLGAQHFLNAMALALFAPDHVHIIEGGVGLAAACLAAAGLGWRMQLGRAGATLLMLVPLIYRPWYINISSTTTTVAVLIALCSALIQLFQPAALRGRWLLISGLLLGAVCSLKSTTIPTAGILVAVTACLAALAQKSWRPLGLGLLAAGAGFIAMTPWMLWQYHSSGTLLYPLLGRGFHVEVFFPSAPMPFHGVVIAQLKNGLVLPIAIMAGLLLAWTLPALRVSVDRPTACVTIAVVSGWAVAWPLVAISTEYSGVARYLLAARIVALTMVLACAWHAGLQLARLPGWRWARGTGPLFLIALLLGHRDELQTTYGEITPHDVAYSVAGQPHYWTSLTDLVHTAQATVPLHAKILAYSDMPFLFDFTSNPIFVADWPGESSLPPGLPVHQGAEAVAAYLLSHDIRYVIYSYKDQANFSRAVYDSYLDPIYGRVANRTAALSFAFQDDLADLAQTRARLYDDGYLYVLDLAHRLPPKPAKS